MFQGHSGKYELINESKYIGKNVPIFRSSYERAFFEWADKRDMVKSWGSEVIVIPYIHPIEKRKARYYMDIILTYEDKNGEQHTELIEIKPMAQCVPPKKGGGKRAEITYARAQATWLVNQAKWQAAEKYARARGWVFRIVTEKSIFGG